MNKQQASYRQIFKATSIFGGVQVINILITVIRGKLLSILLGSAGMGLNGLFFSTITLLQNLTSLGLPQSAIKEIAAAQGTNDQQKVGRVASVFNGWIWITAILGMAITIGLSPYLSQWTFGNKSYTWAFIILSVIFLFGALTSQIYTMLRGLRRVNALAKASIFGSAGGLAVSLPFFYFMGIEGIVPAIVASAFATFLISRLFRKQAATEKVDLSWREIRIEGMDMVRLGVNISLGAFLTSGAIYLLSVFISRMGSMNDLGLYNAGVTITSSYIGMVFTAMSTDYFPRLAESLGARDNWQEIVLQQAELVVLVLAPILVILITSAPILIQILLTEEFLAITAYINWSIFGLLLKGLVWSLGYIMLAKGDYRIFLKTEFLGIIIFLITHMTGYYIGGLEGLGIALLINNFLSLLLVGTICYFRYDFRFPMSFFFMVLVLTLFCSIAFLGAILAGYPTAYFTGLVSIILVSAYSLFHLNKRLNLKGVLSAIQKRYWDK